jgi:lysophospholipase L1-like esterase
MTVVSDPRKTGRPWLELADAVLLTGGRKVAFVGDSITFVGKPGYDVRHYGAWATALSKQSLEVVNINGNNGYTTAQIAASLAPTISAAPEVAFVLAGANDIPTATALSSVYGSYRTIHDALRSAGIWPVFIAPFPTNSWGATENARASEMGDYLRGLAEARTCGFIDGFDAMADTGTTILSAFTYDGVHPNKKGAYAIGSLVAEYIDAWFPKRAHSSKRGVANACPNPYFTGTAGAKNSGATGTVPTSWSGSKSVNGETVAFSIAQVGDMRPRNKVIATVGGGTAGVVSAATLATIINPLPAGTYYAEGEITITGTLTLVGVNVRLQSFIAPTFRGEAMNDSEPTVVMQGSEFDGLLRSNEVTSAGQETVLYMEVQFQDGSGTIEFNNPRVVLVE